VAAARTHRQDDLRGDAQPPLDAVRIPVGRTLDRRIARSCTMNAHERAAAMIDDRLTFAREVVETVGRFPTYEVPEEVRVRYPTFDPGDPSTWPEPDRCTEGRPWGLDAYGSVWGDAAARWRVYLSGVGARRCRNRWKDPELRLCGTHVNAYRQLVTDNERRLARYAREEEHRALARDLHELHGIEADSSAAGVFLTAGAARALLELLNRGPVPL
jgi:hypothetical protein